MTVVLKVIHIAALSIWCVGLFAMPALLARRRRQLDAVASEELHRFTRRLFIEIMSPAAVVAIAAGTALVFQREVLTNWMYAKLAAVSLLVLIHLRAGRLITATRLHLPYGWLRQAGTLATTAAVTTAILWLVLAKPTLDADALPPWTREPGGLQSLLDTIRPIP
jgi:protoporphyrinogen IX oxidase